MSEAATSLFVLGFTFLLMFFVFAYIVVVYAMVFGIIILVLAGMAVWMFMLIDCLQREEDDFPDDKPNEKNNWLVILLVSFACGMAWLGALIYYVKVKKPSSKPLSDASAEAPTRPRSTKEKARTSRR